MLLFCHFHSKNFCIDIGDPVDEVNGDVKVPENDVDET